MVQLELQALREIPAILEEQLALQAPLVLQD
jgi:hypothetical protein